MAPKIGPRGITIQDVQDVVNNGSQAGKSQYVYAPTATTTATTPIDYAALLAGGPASTYGQKYGGQPSAEYFNQLVTGAAMQAKSVGDLAAMQAAINQQNLTSKFASDLRSGTNRLLPTFVENFNQPITSDSSTQNLQIQNLTPAISDLEARLAERKLYARRIGAYEQQRQGIGKQIDIIEAELRDARRAMGQVNPLGKTPEQFAAENKANAYGAYMARMNMLDTSGLSSANNTTNEGAASRSLQPGLPALLRSGAQRQTATNLTPRFESALAEQVTPYADVAENFANTPLSDFAQQIAVQRYGYDPALAQGLFGTDIDVQAMKDEAALFAAQNPQLSMTAAEAVFQMYGQDGLDKYVANMAQEAIYGTPAQQEAAAQAAEDAANAPIDADLVAVYGVKPAQVSPNDVATAREVMTDPNFLAQFKAGLAAIALADSENTPSQLEAQFVQQFMNDGGEPVTAILLDALLKKYTFG